jgi:glycosyltransferase involved in cell wall biosynthesis
MKILYVMPRVTHPTIRGELRHYHFLQRLAKQHDITLLVLSGRDVPSSALDELSRWTRHLVQIGTPPPHRPAGRGIAGAIAHLRWRVQKIWRFHRGVREMRECVRHRLQSGGFDLLLLSGSDLHPVVKGLSDVPMVVDWCDTDSVRLRRELRHTRIFEWPWRFLRYRHTRRTEQRLFRQLRHVTFVSWRDRDAVPEAKHIGTVIPNGCDVTYWTPRSAERGQRIVFTGVLDYAPNADAARYLLSTIAPLVRREIPDLEVVIAGRNPSPEMVALGKQSQGVTVTGTVPDLRPYLAGAAVFVAPLRFASGMQNKILEAMAMELPVVTTPVAAAGFRHEGREEPPLMVGERPGELAAQIASIMRDPLSARRLGAEGRRYVRRHCDWERSARMLDRLCRHVADTQSVAGRSGRFDRRRHLPATRSTDRVFRSLV